MSAVANAEICSEYIIFVTNRKMARRARHALKFRSIELAMWYTDTFRPPEHCIEYDSMARWLAKCLSSAGCRATATWSRHVRRRQRDANNSDWLQLLSYKQLNKDSFSDIISTLSGRLKHNLLQLQAYYVQLSRGHWLSTKPPAASGKDLCSCGHKSVEQFIGWLTKGRFVILPVQAVAEVAVV